MNTLYGYGASATGWPGANFGNAGAQAASTAPRWFDGLDAPRSLQLGADVPAAAAGLSPDQHAQRVLAHLVAPQA